MRATAANGSRVYSRASSGSEDSDGIPEPNNTHSRSLPPVGGLPPGAGSTSRPTPPQAGTSGRPQTAQLPNPSSSTRFTLQRGAVPASSGSASSSESDDASHQSMTDQTQEPAHRRPRARGPARAPVSPQRSTSRRAGRDAASAAPARTSSGSRAPKSSSPQATSSHPPAQPPATRRPRVSAERRGGRVAVVPAPARASAGSRRPKPSTQPAHPPTPPPWKGKPCLKLPHPPHGQEFVNQPHCPPPDQGVPSDTVARVGGQTRTSRTARSLSPPSHTSGQTQKRKARTPLPTPQVCTHPAHPPTPRTAQPPGPLVFLSRPTHRTRAPDLSSASHSHPLHACTSVLLNLGSDLRTRVCLNCFTDPSPPLPPLTA